MNAILTLVMITFFPLSSYVVLKDSGKVFESGNNAASGQELPSIAGNVEGSENKKEELVEKKTFQFSSSFKPARKEMAYDLVLPNAHSSLILDAESGTILHYNKGKERRQIASLTKLMTAVLAMEKIPDLNEEVVIDEEAVFIEGTKIGCPRSGYCISPRLKVGEKVKAKDLLKAMLMNSANDAALALAKHISGTQEKFAELMNEKAKYLELGDSNFCTASGLEIDGKESECYSSAYDIARVAAYSLKYDLIWEIFRLPNNTTIYSADGKCTHDIINTDLVLDQIPNCLGGKTGFTPLAGHSLLLAASDPTGQHEIIAVVLDDPYRWQDIKTMTNWAFSSYEWK